MKTEAEGTVREDKDLRDALAIALQEAETRLDPTLAIARLTERFGSVAALFEAAPKELGGIPGITSKLATFLSVTPEMTRYTARERASVKGALTSLRAAGAFLKTLYLGQHSESCHLMSLDDEGTLIDCRRIQSGTVNETQFYVRLAVEEALRTGARAAVLSHNHPGGSAYASQADMESTLKTMRALAAAGITLIDHVIVADGISVSMRKDETPEADCWQSWAPLPQAWTNWLR